MFHGIGSPFISNSPFIFTHCNLHYSLHIYFASFPSTFTQICSLSLYTKHNDSRSLFFAMGITSSKIPWWCNVYVYATLIWFLKLSSGQIAAQLTKIMIHLGTNINYPLSYLITFLQVQALDFSMEWMTRPHDSLNTLYESFLMIFFAHENMISC
jgi:hypothetical protein